MSPPLAAVGDSADRGGRHAPTGLAARARTRAAAAPAQRDHRLRRRGRRQRHADPRAAHRAGRSSTTSSSPGATRCGPGWSLLFAAAGITFALAYLRRYRGGQVAFAVQYDLRNRMHDHLHEPGPGDAVAAAHRPAGLARELRLGAHPGTVAASCRCITGNLLMMLLSLVVMFVLSPLLALLALVVVPALFAVSYRMRRRVFPATWDAQQREGDVAQIVDEGVTGVRVVKAFGQEGRELERLADAAERLYGSRLRATRLNARYQPLLETIPTAGAGGDPAARRPARPARLDQHRHVPRLLAPTSASSSSPARQLAGDPHRRPAGPRRRRADLPAARPAPGHRRRAGRGRAAATCAARSSSTPCASATPPTARC